MAVESPGQNRSATICGKGCDCQEPHRLERRRGHDKGRAEQGSRPLVAVEAPGQNRSATSVEKAATAKSLTDWSVGEGTTKDAQNRAPDRSWLSRRQAKIDPLLSVEKVATKPSEPSEDKFDLLSPQDYGMDQDRAINSPAKSLTHWSIGEGTTKDAQNRARGRAWPSSWLSRRQTNLLLFLGLVMAALFMYVHYLRETIDILLDITEVDVGFDNGAIQANLTISSQFLPGESAKDPVWASILGGRFRCVATSLIQLILNHICSNFTLVC